MRTLTTTFKSLIITLCALCCCLLLPACGAVDDTEATSVEQQLAASCDRKCTCLNSCVVKAMDCYAKAEKCWYCSSTVCGKEYAACNASCEFASSTSLH